MEDEGDVLVATLEDTVIKMHWKTAGAGDEAFEAIEVQAGEFPEAVKVTREIEMEVNLTLDIDGDKQTIDTTLTIETTIWYEPYVGMLKQQADHATIRLFGAKFPIEVDEQMELVEYRVEE